MRLPSGGGKKLQRGEGKKLPSEDGKKLPSGEGKKEAEERGSRERSSKNGYMRQNYSPLIRPQPRRLRAARAPLVDREVVRRELVDAPVRPHRERVHRARYRRRPGADVGDGL